MRASDRSSPLLNGAAAEAVNPGSVMPADA